MQQLLISSPSSHRLIVFANGWSMPPASVEGLAIPQDTDLLHLWDYRSDAWTPPDWDQYTSIYWVAWSMGVWQSERLWQTNNIPTLHGAIALSGTPFIMHDRWGIPRTFFEGTLRSLTPQNRDKFNRRMCGGKRLKHLFEALCARTTEEIRDELQRVFELECQRPASDAQPHPLRWTEAHAGSQDLIVPYRNQKAYWAESSDVRFVSWQGGDHYLFDLFASWTDLIPQLL